MDENPYSAPQEKPHPTGRKQRRPSWSDFVIATLLVFLGIAGWFFGLGFGLAGAGAWAEFIFYAGPVIGAVGAFRLLVLLFRLIPMPPATHYPREDPVTFHATSRWGIEGEPSRERMLEILSELSADQSEVSLTHKSGWCLGASSSGVLVWETLKSGEPRHLDEVPHERVLELWERLSRGEIEEIENQPWLPGYQ